MEDFLDGVDAQRVDFLMAGSSSVLLTHLTINIITLLLSVIV